MGCIKNFKKSYDIDKYLSRLNLKGIGMGTEGTCYKDKNNKYCYKRIMDPHKPIVLDKVITVQDTKVRQYLLPMELYVVNNTLLAYKTKFIPNDLFNMDINPGVKLQDIYFNKFIDAYKRLREDTYLLTEDRVHIYDLPCNLVYDGKNLYGIDTIEYYKDDKSNLLKDNLNSLNFAIKRQICLIETFQENKIIHDDFEDFDTIDFLKEYKKIYKK